MSKKVSKEEKTVEACGPEGCCEKPSQNGPTKEHLEQTSVAFYNAALKMVEAGALIMPYNNPLGMTIIKMAEALTDQLGKMTGYSQNNETCNNGQQQNTKPKIELDEATMKEIEALEKELDNDLGDL